MLTVEHLSSACPCKALSWALTGDGTRLPDLQLPTLSTRGRDLPALRPWSAVLRSVCTAGASGKATERGRSVSEDRSRPAEPPSASRALPRAAGRKGDA